MPRLLLILAALILFPQPAMARVMLAFHSFNGSWAGGRYPHAFIALDGTLDATGEKIHQNFGYTARSVTPAILTGNVPSEIYVEKEHYVRSTNVHFTVPLSDAQYRLVMDEVERWGHEPGKGYNLDTHNCIHFVARIAELVGLTAPVPAEMVRRPKKWLNYVAGLNPLLGARAIP
ncbi:MAG: hypothetical protein JSS36_06280 [Proteobacteria bacterium]|nr:hypothetical protein [Pseudomonadota bacterium]